MTTYHVYAPTCGFCGAFLNPVEREANLKVFSTMLSDAWPLPLKLLCGACYDDDSPGPDLASLRHPAP